MISRDEEHRHRKSKYQSASLRGRQLALMLIFALLGPAWMPASLARSAENAALKFHLNEDLIKNPPLILEQPKAAITPSRAARGVLFQEFDEQETVIPWRWNPPGEVIAPILLYHHVGTKETPSRYFVSPSDFAAQMRSLQEWGYTAIPLSLLVQALTVGAALPPRPVVISFDDGYQDVYLNAFPVLQELGYPAIVFIITGQLEIGGYMHPEELRTLQAAGWEIGSHTQTHTSLRAAEAWLENEILHSRLVLEAALGEPVSSFSFPYGLTSLYVTGLVKESGYASAVGLGGLSRHTIKTQFYLSRIEIYGDCTIQEFARMLPWAAQSAPPESSEPQSPRKDVQ